MNMEYHTILIKRKIIIIGFIGFIGFDLPTAGRDPCNSCNSMITFLGDDFLHMLKLMKLPSRGRIPTHWPLLWQVRLVSLPANWRRRAGAETKSRACTSKARQDGVIPLAGLSILFIVISGLWMYWVGFRRKKK